MTPEPCGSRQVSVGLGRRSDTFLRFAEKRDDPTPAEVNR